MNGLREWRRRWAQASLEYDLAHGRRAYGRSDPTSGGSISAEMPVAVTIDAVVIRSDGTREDLGTISQNTQSMTSEQLQRLEAVAGRKERRGKR